MKDLFRNFIVFILITAPVAVMAVDMSQVKIGPVPFKPQVDRYLNIYNETGGQATVTIYDINGDICYEASSSANPFYWNGRNSKGGAVSSGLYIIRITVKANDGSSSGTKTFRVPVVR